MKTTKGFTLIELLVVITIIGILATGASAVYTSAQEKARNAVIKSDLAVMRSAIELTATDKGYYPGHTDGADAAASLPLFAANIATYLPVIPTTPTTSYQYISNTVVVAGTPSTDATTYELGATLETNPASRHEVSNATLATLDSAAGIAIN